jgi:hypothetical protein
VIQSHSIESVVHGYVVRATGYLDVERTSGGVSKYYLKVLV